MPVGGGPKTGARGGHRDAERGHPVHARLAAWQTRPAAGRARVCGKPMGPSDTTPNNSPEAGGAISMEDLWDIETYFRNKGGSVIRPHTPSVTDTQGQITLNRAAWSIGKIKQEGYPEHE